MDYYSVDWAQMPVWIGLIALVVLIIGIAYAISWIVDWLFRDAY